MQGGYVATAWTVRRPRGRHITANGRIVIAMVAALAEVKPAQVLAQALDTHENERAYAWDLASIQRARDEHMRGRFRESAALAEACKTDAVIFGAQLNRGAPLRGLPMTIGVSKGADKRRTRVVAEATATFIERGPLVAPLSDAGERLAFLGLSVLHNDWTPSDDGTRLNVCPRPWPMASVYYDHMTRKLMTTTRTGERVEIVHGDGRWVVIQHNTSKPWQWGAIKALALVWGMRAFTNRDRQRSSASHGMNKILGEMPPNYETDSPAGAAFAELLQRLQRGSSGGVTPPGAKITLLQSNSQAWQIFSESLKSLNSEVAYALLGQDGTLTNEGGNYIKAAQLFGVRSDIVEADLGSIGRGVDTGILRPWSLLNFGFDAQLTLSWAFPDADKEARFESLGKRLQAYAAAVKAIRESGLELTQEACDRMAEGFDVEPLKLGAQPAPTTPKEDPAP